MVRKQLIRDCTPVCFRLGRFLSTKEISHTLFSDPLVELDDRLELRDDLVEFSLSTTDLLDLTREVVQFVLVNSRKIFEFGFELRPFGFERGDTLLFGFEIVGDVLKLGLCLPERIELFGSRIFGVGLRLLDCLQCVTCLVEVLCSRLEFIGNACVFFFE
ncbi:hypothetical protein HAPAU_41770 [Halalkalicoccus paucihalophilus]|uniref:Uncharacterized protein n=1 Tax=Halalkalicoccus paucihalophilus TaxID=1008153 RepID=A0A151A7S2_9EURY|nr:hypothetical protein HAPAU_41770 [Halalkalicoccus paucihalophilus]